jgi:hypothetical protein
MKIIAHRRNTLAQLLSTPLEYGIEVDIRSRNKQLIIDHDPFVGGEDFVSWIDEYQHGTLILNVKEEGLEVDLKALLQTRGVSDYFFLDQSFPALINAANTGEKRCAIRVSEYESIETALAFAGRIDWVWVDCFTRFPLQKLDVQRLQQASFKLCLVSPELQGHDPVVEIPALIELLTSREIVADAVCTKRADLWLPFCSP